MSDFAVVLLIAYVSAMVIVLYVCLELANRKRGRERFEDEMAQLGTMYTAMINGEKELFRTIEWCTWGQVCHALKTGDKRNYAKLPEWYGDVSAFIQYEGCEKILSADDPEQSREFTSRGDWIIYYIKTEPQ